METSTLATLRSEMIARQQYALECYSAAIAAEDLYRSSDCLSAVAVWHEAIVMVEAAIDGLEAAALEVAADAARDAESALIYRRSLSYPDGVMY